MKTDQLNESDKSLDFEIFYSNSRHAICIPLTMDNLLKMQKVLGFPDRYLHRCSHTHLCWTKNQLPALQKYGTKVESRELLKMVEDSGLKVKVRHRTNPPRSTWCVIPSEVLREHPIYRKIKETEEEKE